jgi:hypothetical protein
MKKLTFTFEEVKPMTKEEAEEFRKNQPERHREVIRMLRRIAKLYPNLGIKLKE